MHKVKIFILLAFGLSTFHLTAQQVSVTLEPQKILIGEQAQLTFILQFAAEARMEQPVFNEMINEKIEIVDYGASDTLATSNQAEDIVIERSLKVTSWEEGFHAIEPFEFSYIQHGDTLVLETEPLLLEVVTVPLEEDAALKDIKPLMRAPITLAELKYYILGAILLIIAIWLLLRYLKKRKKKPQPESIWEKPDIPAHVAAINSLEQLRSKKLWQQDKTKEYYIILNDIERHYIEKRFNIGAMEMTSSEIMAALQSVEALKPHRKDLQAMLGMADMVKFAKYSPSPNENEISMDMAFEFVNKTKVEVKPEQSKS